MKDKELQKEVEAALEEESGDFNFQAPMGEEDSPLNLPVIEKEEEQEEHTITEQEEPEDSEEEPVDDLEEESEYLEPPFTENEPPEQIFEESYDPLNPPAEQEESFELPNEEAKVMVNTVLGMTNNFLGLGMGFFVKIKKTKDFYEFEEVVQAIDDLNEANLKRVKLDEEDKALIRPLLIQILKKKAKNITPEQQLMGAVVSILIKKVQIMAAIKKQNQMVLAQITELLKGKREEEAKESPESEVPEEIKQAA